MPRKQDSYQFIRLLALVVLRRDSNSQDMDEESTYWEEEGYCSGDEDDGREHIPHDQLPVDYRIQELEDWSYLQEDHLLELPVDEPRLTMEEMAAGGRRYDLIEYVIATFQEELRATERRRERETRAGMERLHHEGCAAAGEWSRERREHEQALEQENIDTLCQLLEEQKQLESGDASVEELQSIENEIRIVEDTLVWLGEQRDREQRDRKRRHE